MTFICFFAIEETEHLNILDGIYDRTMQCLIDARKNNMPTNLVAEIMAKKRLEQ